MVKQTNMYCTRYDKKYKTLAEAKDVCRKSGALCAGVLNLNCHPIYKFSLCKPGTVEFSQAPHCVHTLPKDCSLSALLDWGLLRLFNVVR